MKPLYPGLVHPSVSASGRAAASTCLSQGGAGWREKRFFWVRESSRSQIPSMQLLPTGPIGAPPRSNQLAKQSVAVRAVSSIRKW